LRIPGDGRVEVSLRRSMKRLEAMRRAHVFPQYTGLDKLIEKATVDCHDETEQASGLFTMKA
jgi:hypothetical protein